MGFVRYETDWIHARRPGVYLGVFAAVNTLSRRGLLAAEHEAFRKATNRWYDENLPLPTDSHPDLYTEAQPHAAAWFRETAGPYLRRIPGYLAILDAHGIAWRELRSDDPGEILYEDAYQVIAAR